MAKNISITGVYQLDRSVIKKALRCLQNNGIEKDECPTVLQALSYILMDVEIADLLENSDYNS